MGNSITIKLKVGMEAYTMDLISHIILHVFCTWPSCQLCSGFGDGSDILAYFSIIFFYSSVRMLNFTVSYCIVESCSRLTVM